MMLLPMFSVFNSLQAQFSFSGKVETSKNEVLPGAIIEISELKRYATTTSSGTFRFSDIPAGEYHVNVRFIGYNSINENISIRSDLEKTFVLTESVTTFEEVIVSSIRAQKNTPTTFAIIPKKDIVRLSLGENAPMILSYTPSTVATSDAGNGIGYSSIRIRGIEASKTNVTINGIPLNDPESHEVFWVDVPDMVTSAQSIQIQRGVGTSTNGAGAFGATINMLTNNVSQNPFFEYNGSAGSFSTLKNSMAFGTGLIDSHWFLEGKVTAIKSDGYIDRARSNLSSYFAQTGYYSQNTIIKLIGFGGREETYQAWYGIDSATLYNPEYGRTYNWTGAYTDKDGNIKFYNDMIDHYDQDHVQLHYLHNFSDSLNFNVALHYTYGRGYYQDFVPKDWYMSLDYFKLPLQISNNDTIRYTDVIQRLWLDNHFYGFVWGLNYFSGKWALTFGGGANRYAPAKHYGQVMWARYFLDDLPGKHFYDNESEKNDINCYLKANYHVFNNLMLFGDIQYRYVYYNAWGENREYDNNVINIGKTYNFINPKIGLIYSFSRNLNVYSSFAVANREPTRSDFVDAKTGEEPKPERLYDFEAGCRYASSILSGELIVYNMQYHDQLVLTGEVNSVGTYIRRNVGKSYHKGIEILGKVEPLQYLSIEGNATFSKNKTEYAIMKDSAIVHYKNKDIAFSPNIIAGLNVTVKPYRIIELSLMLKHVGKQYFDNTQSNDRMLDAYTITDLLCCFNFKWQKSGHFQLTCKINNLFNTLYISNARIDDNGTKYYYPQAGRNYLMGISLKF
jgi:iron complex outermembrane receptor protein